MRPQPFWRPAGVLAVMLCAALAAVAVRPQKKMAESQPAFRLDAMIPLQFGDWRPDPDDTPVLPSPELQAAINKAYEQTIDRSYVDSRGRRVMLSVAYSGDYNKGMQWHRPENCYPSQGFSIAGPTMAVTVPTAFGPIDAARLVAQRGARIEPMTYWFILGERQARFGLDLRWHQVLYGLTGAIPHGLLIRVSSIGGDLDQQFVTQEDFAKDLVTSIRAPDRPLFMGAMANATPGGAGG